MMMQSDFWDAQSDFSKCVNNPSMSFKNPKYEEKYHNQKFKNKNLIIVIGVSLFYSFLMINLLNTGNYFLDNLNIKERKSSSRILKSDLQIQQESSFELVLPPQGISISKESSNQYTFNESTSNGTNSEKPSNKNSSNDYASNNSWRLNNQKSKMTLVNIILSFSVMIVEAVIYFIPKLRYLRGFFIITNSMMTEIVRRLVNTGTFNPNMSVFNKDSIYQILCLIIFCFLYSSNWICGSLQILIIVGIFDINIFSNTMELDYDIPFDLIFSFVCASTLCILIYFSEYFQRETFFRRMEIEEQRKTIKEILEKIPEPIIIAQNGKAKWCNESFNSIKTLINPSTTQNTLSDMNNQTSFFSLSETEDKTYKNILSCIKSKNEEKNMKDILSNNIFLNDEEFTINYKDEKMKHYEVSSKIFSMKECESIIYFMRDVSNSKKVDDLKAKKKYQRIYFASISHDFRTPLSIISGNYELLIDSVQLPEQKHQLTNIQNATILLSLLVQDILDFSQIKAGTLTLNFIDFDIEKSLNVIVDLYRDKYVAKGLFLDLILDPNVDRIVNSDEGRIKQILLNLVSNAFKFTLKGGVKICVCKENLSNLIQVKVTDTGVGMANEDKSKLFKEFGKLQRHSNMNPNGVGLGLKICKQIVEKMGGSISVESLLNIGTTFQFSFKSNPLKQSQNDDFTKIPFEEDKHNFPLLGNKSNCGNPFFWDSIRKPEKHEELIKNDYESDLHQTTCKCAKILIIDDDLSLRNILRCFSQKMNIISDEADNGIDAIDKVKLKMESDCCKYYDLILTDYNMPMMNGLDCAFEIKKLLQSGLQICKSNIVLTSGISNEEKEVIDNLSNSPFSSIEFKPISYAKFFQLVQKFITTKY